MNAIDLWWTNTIVATPFLWEETSLGIDWGESINAYAVTGYRGKVLVQGKVQETPDGVKEIMGVLRRFAHPETGELPPVGIETPRRLIVAGLVAEGVRIVPLNPKMVKTARGVITVRDAPKTDALDAILIAEMLRKSPEAYVSMHATTDQAKAITLLHRANFDAVKTAQRHAARLRSALAEYHPNAVAAFTASEMADNLAAYNVLLDALTSEHARALTTRQIRNRLTRPGARKQKTGEKLDKAIARVHEAFQTPALCYPAEFEAAFVATVRTDLEVLKAAVTHKMAVETRLEAAVKAHPLYALLLPAKGAGIGAIGGLIAEMGDDPKRFRNADRLMAYAGSAPTIEQSGGHKRISRRSLRGNRLHEALWHWAESASNHHPGAKAYYWARRERSKHPHVIRKMMNKILRGVYACHVNGTIWDDDRVWDATVTKQQAEQIKVTVRDKLRLQKAAEKAA